MTEPKAPSAEDRASKVANSLRRTWKLNLGFGSNAATEIAFQIRAAESAATRKAWEEAAKWHEMLEQQHRVIAEGHAVDGLTDSANMRNIVANEHRDAAAHFRALAEREKGGE